MSRPRWLRPPDDLDERAKKAWNYYASGLWRAEKLTHHNVERFKILCRLLGVAGAAGAAISTDGVTIMTKAGEKKRHPALSALFEANRQIGQILPEFGLDEADGRIVPRLMR